MLSRTVTQNQHIDFHVKWYVTHLTTGQDEDFTARCLFDCEYFKNHCSLIAIDFSRQNELLAYLKAIQEI